MVLIMRRLRRGAGSQPGFFHAFKVTAKEDVQIAYEFGLRHSAKAVALLGELPAAVFDDLVKLGLARVEKLIRAPAEFPYQVVFSPESFATVNTAVHWKLLDPEEDA